MGYAYNNTFNTAGQYELDLSGMTPNIPFNILIEDNNGEIFTLEFGGLSYAWTYTLTNSTLGVQNNFAYLSIQIGDVNDQTLNIPTSHFTIVQFTLHHTHTPTFPNHNGQSNPNDLVLDYCIVHQVAKTKCGKGLKLVGGAGLKL